jgi:hypothetical protein
MVRRTTFVLAVVLVVVPPLATGVELFTAEDTLYER